MIQMLKKPDNNKKNNKNESETTARLLATESKVLLTVWLVEKAERYPVSYTAQTDTLGVGGLVIGRNKSLFFHSLPRNSGERTRDFYFKFYLLPGPALRS